MNQSLRFGVVTLQNKPWSRMVENWKLVEALGLDSVWVADHFVNPHLLTDDWFDGWTMLAALATQTSRIRVGTLVSNIILRNPAMLAKQALTLDHISQGRLELGIGATSKGDPSHHMIGMEVWETRERVRRYHEVVEIVDMMLRNEVTDYQGQYYSVKDARMKPAPVQKPRPPLLLSAIGTETLKIVAKYADTWNTYGGWNLTPDQSVALIKQRNELLDEYCARLGRNPQEIRRSFMVGITQDTPCASLEAFYDFVGRYTEAGMSEFIFFFDYPLSPNDRSFTHENIERFATIAIPTLKQKA